MDVCRHVRVGRDVAWFLSVWSSKSLKVMGRGRVLRTFDNEVAVVPVENPIPRSKQALYMPACPVAGRHLEREKLQT